MTDRVRTWLSERGISEAVVRDSGCILESNRLKFPRKSREGTRPADSTTVLGYKVRDLERDSHFNEPVGVSHKDTWPFMAREVAGNVGVMICEGESDALRLASTYIPERFGCDVMCVPGANAFPAEWAALLRSYESVYVLPDGDEAGAQLVNRIAQLAPGARRVRLPDGGDVCSFLSEHPSSALEGLLQSSAVHIPPAAPVRRHNWDFTDAGSAPFRDRLVRVLLADGVLLRRRGNEFVGICPFHEEGSPSFSVNPTKGLYRCFGCGRGGDVASYLMETRSIGFGQAMKLLKEMR